MRRPEKVPEQSKASTQLVLPADALNDLPSDYAAAAAAQRRRDVPKLGAPIGGEFGATQLDMKNEATARSSTVVEDPVGKLLADMTLARLKRRAAARDAKPDFGDHSSASSNGIPAMDRMASPQTAMSNDAAALSSRDQDNRQDDKRGFASSRRADSPYLDQAVLTPSNAIYVGAGTLISAVLLSGINSDLPGA